ncbi:sensor histidine kinase [Paenibacillus sp. H1-7]|uniref:cache domain-containing sensor histidine kinase n=1 Tax=Paenibacillus sp. H1-7 TaxID=2282849 RepID=UPI001EF98B83|nr:sensor histidine kinase [Paenibacillus sp. H1-7]
MFKFNRLELNYRNKLIITFVLVVFLPSIVMHYITYMNSTQTMKTKINDLVTHHLIQTNKHLNATLSMYEDTLYQLMLNEEVVHSTKKMLYGSDFEQLVNSDTLQRIFEGYTNSKAGIRGFTFFDKNGNILLSYDKDTDMTWNPEREGTPFLLIMKLNGMQEEPLITAAEKLKTDSKDAQYGFHIARKLFGISSGRLERMGYIVMTLEESVLANAISNTSAASSPNGIDSTIYLIDANNIIVSSPDKSKIGARFDDLLDDTTMRFSDSSLPEAAVILGQASVLNHYPNEKTGWTIVNVTSEKKMFAELYAMQKLNIWTGSVVFLFSTLLIVYFSGLLTRSIHTIVNAMKQTEHGNLNVKVEERTGDEISIIAASYNKMMETINELMEETKCAVQKQKESEIRSLEAQINPHFLYNTLDSINWMAIEKDEHDISRMLKGLALILRYSISHSNKMVPLAKELEWLEHYLYLQKHRFNDSFQYYVHLKPELNEAKLYKLLLQPFVENSLVHGFAGMKTGAELHIRFYITEIQRLCIEIEDNGCGMDEASVSSMQHGSLDPDKSDAAGSGIGVRNVMDRLHLYYGEAAECRIMSQKGCGTKVTLLLPIQFDNPKEAVMDNENRNRGG